MMRTRLIVLALPVVLPLLVLPGVIAQQEQPTGVETFVDPVMAAAQIEDYWTPERMASAVPGEPPPRLVQYMSQSAPEPMPYAVPGLVNAWDPRTGPYVEQRMSFPRAVPQLMTAPQAFGTAPTNPQSGPYGPFQRWTMQGSYTPWPRAIHGKLFFSFGASNFVCSATVIGVSTIATAGHCVSNGSGAFATNVLFCPSYNQGGPLPGRGCWSVISLTTSTAWHTNADPDYDYACGVTNVVGTVVANKIGNVTGAAGRAFNWVDQPEMTFGYPQAAPFNGTIIQQTASVDWYNVDFEPGTQVSKVIGSDLTGGSSGGGWFLSWRAPGAEVVDTDNNAGTDPAGGNNGPYINGVNSHKRCSVHCGSPPNATMGIFWQEMTSPPFRNDGTGDSEDVFGVCLAHGNNSAPAKR